MELHSWEEIFEVLNREPENRRAPRVKENPYGDNAIGMAFDEWSWSALRWARKMGLVTEER